MHTQACGHLPGSLDEHSDDPLTTLLGDLDFKDFTAVSRNLVEGYRRIFELGLPANSIAVAMMYATMNFFRLFGFDERLPAMLRETADLLEAHRGDRGGDYPEGGPDLAPGTGSEPH